MKSRFLMNLCLFCFLSIASYAQDQDAVISFSEEKFDYGTIKESAGPVNHVFEFVNTGGSPLIIQKVAASCGCTTPEWTNKPVPPGGKGIVKATFDPSGRPGTFNKTITVTSNATNKPSYILSFNGTVIPKQPTLEEQFRIVIGDLRFRSTHASFQNMGPASTKTDTLEFINMGKNPVTIGFSKVPAFLKAVALPATVKPAGKGKIIVTYVAAKKNDWGFLKDEFYLTLNGKSDITQKITVTATIEEDFSKLTPAQRANAPHIKFEKTSFLFGTIKENQKTDGVLSLKNTGKTDLIIRRIETSCGCTVATISSKVVKPGTTVSLNITFDAHGVKKSEQNKTITITTNDPDNVRTVVYVKGNVE